MMMCDMFPSPPIWLRIAYSLIRVTNTLILVLGYQVDLQLEELPPSTPQITAAFVQRIDATNANAYSEWLKMGMPQDLLPPAQVAQLKAASALRSQRMAVGADGKSVKLVVPLHGVAAVRLFFE
jgi:hypothetical protein